MIYQMRKIICERTRDTQFPRSKRIPINRN